MRKFAIMAAVAATALMALPTAAHAEWYAGAAYTNFDYDGGDVDAVTGRLGYKFNPNFAVEGEASTGLDDGDVELNHNAALYGVAMLPVTDQFGVHGRLGWQTTEADTPFGEVEDDGVAYGVGAHWNFTPGFGLRADYTRLEGDEGEADALSLGAAFNF
ncbi:MAG TPA: porin family protein [Vitreimonas sp.]|uniref:porin family protein n=1 Tax=Vitreimonas sp. TaxID=3069702 RepID=UPI002D5EEFC1|nr:porin family protein [Vitreimonas sp.]HYD87416.1 porin family protein [Vitreimonas sp.]